MNTNRLISITLVAIMALTVVSGAGVLRVQAQPLQISVDQQSHVFSGQQLNYHYNALGTTSSGNTVTMRFTGATSGGSSFMGGVGIEWALNPGSYTPDQLAQILATIRVKGSWSGTASCEQAGFAIGVSNGQEILQPIITESEIYGSMSGSGAIDATYTTNENGAPLTAASIASPSYVWLWLSPRNSGYSTNADLTLTIESIEISFTPTVTKASVLNDLATLRSAINRLPWYSVNFGLKYVMLNTIDTATWQVKYGRYGAAANTLNSQFITRTDGCALRGHPDITDYVRTRDAQKQLYGQATHIVADLKWLQANPP